MVDRSSRAWAAVLPVLGVAALAVGAVILFADADTTPEPMGTAPTVVDIAAHPDDYDGRRL